MALEKVLNMGKKKKPWKRPDAARNKKLPSFFHCHLAFHKPEKDRASSEKLLKEKGE